MSNFALAVDIGGTFTDVVVRHTDGRVWGDKTLTTPRDLREGFFKAIEFALDRIGLAPNEIDDVIVHATTLVTNTLLERKGKKAALLVTRGFEDVLVIRDESRSDIFDIQLEASPPLILPDVTFGINERTLADGTIERRIDEYEVRKLAAGLSDVGVKAVAVCLLNSYKNSTNEQAIREILHREAPEIFISLSSDVTPQMREYPRTSTTAINAYTLPITKPYLASIADRLRESGFQQKLLIMLSNGGVIGADVAGSNPVRMIESGPAAGALAASYFSRLLGFSDLLSFDMGGTTAKACFINNGRPLISGAFEVDRMYRFQPGSGMPIVVPGIDMIEIGAGGGSIAALDDLGLLTVGPQSAGSEPGPACYGRGGASPTVTDADLVLGMLDPESFLGGDMKLDIESSRSAFAVLGRRLNIEIEKLALGVYQVVGESMASALRSHATDRGVDWRGIPLLAFGGAGPVHACHVSELLEGKSVIFPPLASVLSAFGALVTPVRLDLVRSELTLLNGIDWDAIERKVGEMMKEGQRALEEAGCSKEGISFSTAADMRYLGQHNEITVDLPLDFVKRHDKKLFRREFEAAYVKNYGIQLDDLEVEIVSWRITAQGPGRDFAVSQNLGKKLSLPSTKREVTFHCGKFSTSVISRHTIARGTQIRGPVLIQERETTIVVPPGWIASVNEHDCVIAEREEAQ